MSDFIYASLGIEEGILTKELQSIYREDFPFVKEFHGDWGTLAVSESLYNGFQPYETTDFICAVIGGPVLYFRDNTFLYDGGVEGTKSIFNRWLDGDMQWDEDLSGPFAIIIVNKNTSMVSCITDLMSFIPVYIYQGSETVMLSTHVDVLGSTSHQQNMMDVVSKVDFILHGVVTFPYTAYTSIRQIKPASVHSITGISTQYHATPYWIPEEKTAFKSLRQASDALFQGLNRYVSTITGETSNIAQFISGGEDSRVLSALFPQKWNQDAFVFLDHMNREGKLAKKAAKAYGASFNIATRSKLHYLEFLPASTDLVGDSAQYFHAHTFGFHKSCKLNEYIAVFGGLFSDALLKGSHIKKLRGSGRLPFLPQIKRSGYTVSDPVKNSVFTPEVLTRLTERRQAHLEYVMGFRNESAEEWFELWPSSMNMNISNLHANRRLFRSYEPFMAKDVVKISAAVPQKWKLNRRLFHKTAKSLLKPSRWLLHSDGRLPYFPWYINCIVQFVLWGYREIGVEIGFIKGNQGPWGEWKVVMKSSEWNQSMDDYSDGIEVISSALKENDVKKMFEDYNWKNVQRINLMQTLYSNHKKKQNV